MRINILGFGWYGEPLGLYLKDRGHNVVGSTRTEEKRNLLHRKGLSTFVMNPPAKPAFLKESEIIIVNIPPFEGQLDWIRSWDWQDHHWPIFISSTSVLPAPETKNAEILKAEEEYFQNIFKRFSILRFGGLLGNGRHPGKFLSGRKNLEGPLAPVNLIHQSDAIKVTGMVIEKKLDQHIFNVVSSEHPTRKEFYTAYCLKHNLPLPEFREDDLTKGKLVSNADLLPYYETFHSLE